MLDFDKVRALLEAMNREGVRYIVFGALALAAHGLVRATEDVDVFVEPSPDNIERLQRALRSVWNDPNIDSITAEELSGDYPAVVYYPPDEDFGIDFLTRLGEAYSYATLDAQDGSLEGIPVRVVTPRQLYEMKRDTVRWKDKGDADAVRRKFFPEG
jgi:hypothetical protein